MKFVLIISLIPHILCNINFVSRFLKDLQYLENINSVFVLNFNNSKNSDLILKSIQLPKLSLKHGLNMNFLNFPRYETYNSFKYYFNRGFMTVIISLDKHLFQSNLLTEIICFSRENILVIITDKKYKNYVNI